jgi:tRNA dimethylallyltransferase
VAPAFVQAAEAEVANLDRQGRAALLARRDPRMVSRIVEPDRQRLVRALSVLDATGRSLADWQDGEQQGLLDGFEIERFVINPETEVVRARIAERFEQMMDSGAVEEVRKLMALNLPPDLPAMKAIGVREIAAWQSGEMSREAAVERAVIASRQYAKRQRTWLRNRMADWPLWP